jgi:uncharacterized protein YjbI with pentapeptide repeats
MRQVSALLRRRLSTILAVLVLLAVVVVVWIFSAPIQYVKEVDPLGEGLDEASWLRSAQSFDTIAFLEKHLRAVAIIGGGLLILVLLIWALIWLPKRQASGVWKRKDRLTLENAARQTLAQIIGGAVLIAGLFFAWENLDVAQKNIKITQETATENQEIAREGQITDRFTKAIAQLGEQGPEKLAVRLGGIYALERITKESEKDHWPIMEILTAYVRETAPRPPKPPKDAQPSKGDQSPREEPPTTQEERPPRPATDIQAILTVLGRRTQTYGNGEKQYLNLTKTDLRGAHLAGAQLQGADLAGAQLQGANLRDAQLQKAVLWDAQLQGADLTGAELEKADLRGAQLQGARLVAELQGAVLEDAQLQGAWLVGAWLQGAHLAGAQLQGARLVGAWLQGANLRDAQLQDVDLRDAQLHGAFLWGAQLEGAKGLTAEQLSTVKTLYGAHLDPLFLEQIQQQYPQLLEIPEDVKKLLQQQYPQLLEIPIDIEMPEDVKKLQK